MTQYTIEGNIVDTERAAECWPDVMEKHTVGFVSRFTGSTYHRTTLYKSRRGRYYMVHTSKLAHEPGWAEWIGPERAAVFFLRNNFEMPEDLKTAPIKQHYRMMSEVIHRSRQKLENKTALEVSQHLADFFTDFCHYCPVQYRSANLSAKIPKKCLFDALLDHCLVDDKPGVCAKHNYSINQAYKPTDFRHWEVSERMTDDELLDILRRNA